MLRVIAVFIFFTLHLHADNLYVVVAKDYDFESINSEQVRSLFIGKSKELAGISLLPVVCTEQPDHDQFMQRVVRKSSWQFERHWKKMLFTGKATMPEKVGSKSELYELIKRDHHRVGFALIATPETDELSFIRIRF